MLKGRLGLEGAQISQSERHGVIWLFRGRLHVENGTLRFVSAGTDDLPVGDYAVPFQSLSAILLGPGTAITHDALRLLARHGTALVAVGEGGVRHYASLPAGPDRSARARAHATLWADHESRDRVARKMYALRLGEVLPHAEISVLRGLEGARVKQAYQVIADEYGIEWQGRRYDRVNPARTDIPNQAINHVATAVYAVAGVAVAVSGAIPQLGFIHEASGLAFVLDVADLIRESFTIPVAFSAAKECHAAGGRDIESFTRRVAGEQIRRRKIVSDMIDRIKELLDFE